MLFRSTLVASYSSGGNDTLCGGKTYPEKQGIDSRERWVQYVVFQHWLALGHTNGNLHPSPAVEAIDGTDEVQYCSLARCH